MSIKNTLSAKLLQYVRDNPGITGSDIQNVFLSQGTRHSISSTLGRLQRMGLIENRGPVGTRWSQWYPIEFEAVEEEFLKEAQNVYANLMLIPKSEREHQLALYIQNFSKR